jgi:hypothetical protein
MKNGLKSCCTGNYPPPTTPPVLHLARTERECVQNISTMKVKPFHIPLKFIVLFLMLMFVQTTQAQSSCDLPLDIPVNSVDTFYLGSSDMWFRFQATSEAVLLNLITEWFIPQTEIADLVIYGGSCEDPMIHGITVDSLRARYITDLVINDYYYIVVTPGAIAGSFVLSLVESDPIQVYSRAECIPQCDNILFNGNFETVLPQVLIPSFMNLNYSPPQPDVNPLYLDPFNCISGVSDEGLLVSSPKEIYTHMVCQWEAASGSPQISTNTSNNSNAAYMYNMQYPNAPEAIMQKVYMAENIPYLLNFDFSVFNSILSTGTVTGLNVTAYIYGSTTQSLSYNAATNVLICSITGNANSWSSLNAFNGNQPFIYTPQTGQTIYGLIIYPENSIPFGLQNLSTKNHLLIDNITINPPPPQECPVLSGPEVVCPGTTSVTFTIVNYDPVYIYKYSINGGPQQIATGSTISIDLTTISGQSVTLQVSNWCECETLTTTIISCDRLGMDYVFLDGVVITQPHFSDAKVFICGEVEVGANVTFDDHCELYFAPKSSLTVQSGYTLTFDGSLLTDACLLPWKGVYAKHGASSIIVKNECTFQHAINAIATKDGALLDITNSLFRNNETGIKIQQYNPYCPEVIDPLNPPPATPPYPAYIADNVFIRDNSTGISGLQGPYTGIVIDTVFEITIGDYTLPPGQAKNTFSNLDFGVKISYSSVFVYNNLFQNIATGAQIPFHNPTNNHPLEGSVYAWSVPGIVNSGYNTPPPANSCIQKHIKVGGLYQHQPNTFVECNIGVYSDKYKVNIDGNSFEDQYFNAVYCMEPISGSTVKSNTIDQVLDHWALSLNNDPKSLFDVAILMSNIKGTNAGKSINISYNEIINAKTGIGLTNLTSSLLKGSSNKTIVNGNQIFLKNVSQLYKYWHGIRLEGCDRIVVGGNEVESSEPGDAGATEEHVIGIYVSQTTFAAIHNNHHLKNLYSGIFVVGNCLGTQFYCNDLIECQHGFYFKPYGNGVATAISDQIAYDYSIYPHSIVPTDNVWINNLHQYRMNGDLVNSFGSVDWYHRYTNNPPTIYSPYLIQNGNQLYNKIIPQEIAGQSICAGLPISVGNNDWDGEIRSARLGGVVREEIDYVYLNEEFDYSDLETVYELLYSNPDVMNLGEPDDSAYINFYNYMTNSTIAEMTNINELIEANEINYALMNNGVFVASNLIENNMQVVNDIYLNTLAQDIMYDSTQREALKSIAMLTPYLGGKAVYSARVMLGLDPRDFGLQHRLAPETKTGQKFGINAFKAYPNPVTDILTLEILDGMVDGKATAELFDLTGKKVFQTRIDFAFSKAELNIAEIYKGLYLLKVTTDTGSYKSIRVIVK